MKMKNPIFFVVMAAVLWAGCRVQPVEMVGGMTSLQPKDFLSKADTIPFEMKLFNPNRFDMRILDVDLSVVLDSIDLGQIRLASPLPAALTKRDTTLTEFLFVKRKGGAREIMKMGMRSVFQRKPMLAHVDGIVTGRAWGVTKEVEVHESDTIDIFN